MWVNAKLFQTVLDDNKAQSEKLTNVWNTCYALQAKYDTASAQKVKDDVTLDWMRHRINALEKVNSQLLAKVSGIFLPVPEIVPARPGSMSTTAADHFAPSFEDVGDEAAKALGIEHDDSGVVKYTK